MMRVARVQLLIGAMLGAMTCAMHGVVATLEQTEPIVFYSGMYPYEFLYASEKERIRGVVPDLPDERGQVAVSFFTQRATDGSNTSTRVPIGDIHGPWNMLALTYALCPSTTLCGCCTQLPGTTFLKDAGATAFPCTELNKIFFQNDTALSNTFISGLVTPQFGKVSVAGRYKKIGARLSCSAMILDEIGVQVQLGISDIRHTPTVFTDLSQSISTSTCATAALGLVNGLLTSEVAIKNIAREIGLDISEFHKTGVEDLRGSVFWRHAISLNEDDGEDFAKVLLIPFIQVNGSLGTGKPRDPSKKFSVPFGNNGHSSLGFNAGLSFDFEETLELVVAGGGTFFSSRKIENEYVPSHPLQSGIFPCLADVCVKPGTTWQVNALVNARRFIDKLSGFVQFFFVDHSKDSIKLLKPNSLFKPEILERDSTWQQKKLIIGLNYEISPSFSLGGLMDIPISRKNSYRTMGFLFSVAANF